MQIAVIIPGIMGCRLYLPGATGGKGDEVWPPTPFEATTGYNQLANLQRPDLLVGAPIDNILCFDFYRLLDRHLADLGFATGTGGAGPRRVSFSYDWRRDNFDTADKLAQFLKGLHDQGATEILLLAHSMGGLVARLMLEGGRHDAEPWFGAIRLLATLGTPHLGAPLALARIFGLDSAAGISGPDFAALAANRDYPSGYQLIPAPGEAAIWNLASPDVAPVDPYDPAVAADLGMDDVLIGRARAMHDALAARARPGHVRYIYFAGAGHRTATRVNVEHVPGAGVDHSRSVVTRTAAAGDGTVPLYSALPRAGQRQIVVNEHATVFKGMPFRKVLFRLLGGDAGAPVEAVPAGTAPGLGVELSLDQPIYDRGRPVELVMTVTDTEAETGLATTGAIAGRVAVEKVDETQAPQGEALSLPVHYEGPPVSVLTMLIPNGLAPGLYALRFEGEPAAAAPVPFAVREG